MDDRVIIEPIPSLDILLRDATKGERVAVEGFGSEHRRREVLAWRGVVRRILGNDVEVGYDEWGAPILLNREGYISVSHSRNNVAVVFSDAPTAIDIESLSRDFDKILSRYMSPQEALISAHPDFKAIAWCCKETLYKLYRRGGISLVGDIVIRDVDFAAQTLRATIRDSKPITLAFRYFEGDVYTVVVG